MNNSVFIFSCKKDLLNFDIGSESPENAVKDKC